jgi:cytochrome P450
MEFLGVGLVVNKEMDGIIEIKAFYGIMEIMLGIYIALVSDSTSGLLCGSMILFGCSFGRIISSVLHSSNSSNIVIGIHIPIAMAELFGCIIGLHAYMVENQAKKLFMEGRAFLTRRQIPYPTKLDDFVPFCPENIQNPYPFYKALRMEAPVHKPKGLDYYLVSRAADIQTVVRNPDIFSSNLVQILVSSGAAGSGSSSSMKFDGFNAGGIVDVLALQDPPIHTLQRKIAFSGLTPKIFKNLEDKIRELAKTLLQEFRVECVKNNGANWIDHVCLRLPMVVALELIGFPADDKTVRWCKECGDKAVLLMSAVNSPEQFQANTKAGYELFRWIQELYQEKKHAPRETLTDFLGVMIDAVKETKQMTDSEVQSVILQILLAGNDSSASTMGAAMKILCERQDIQQQLRNDKELIPTFVEEVLRYESAFSGHYRKVIQPTELNGIPLRKGDRVMLLWASANRDELIFDNPDEFRLDRGGKGKSHYTFGQGIHLCLGNPLARREIRIVIEELLNAFPKCIKAAEGKDIPRY